MVLISLIGVQIGLFIGFFFVTWMYYELIIFRRTTEIETVLPDFLQEVSVNVRAGMSFDKALWNSVEPEFGVLEKEIENVAKKVMTGEDTEVALKEFSEKYNSTLLQESMDMIIVGLRSGGNISELIDKIVENVKAAYFLKRELLASVTAYIIFITIVAVIISPILFALSFNLMEIIQGLGEKLTSVTYEGIPSFDFKAIDSSDFVTFSKIAVIIIAGVAGMIIADLREGSIRAGLKYLVIFIPISYVVYVVMLSILTGVFGVLV
jgi:pilus assembly protein TadC